jgi:hypothetical protein
MKLKPEAPLKTPDISGLSAAELLLPCVPT